MYKEELSKWFQKFKIHPIQKNTSQSQTLAYKREREDMIEVFQIVSNMYDSKSTKHVLTTIVHKYIHCEVTNLHEPKTLYTATRKNHL